MSVAVEDAVHLGFGRTPQLAKKPGEAHDVPMNQQPVPLPLHEPGMLIGTWRRFGTSGPVYEIVATGSTSSNGEQTMRIRVVETGEEIDYRLSEILEDPREH